MKSLLITPRVQEFISSGRPSRILHIFDEVINLANDLGDLISISTAEIGPGPFSLIMGEDFSALIQEVDLNDPVDLHPEILTLAIGRHTIETEQALIWNPCPPWEKLTTRIFIIHHTEQHVSEDIDIQLNRLNEAVLVNDYNAGKAAVRALAGLGQGLTPSGDDVLMGVIYALHIWRPDTEWIDLIPSWAAPLTTTLSAAFLRAAACGEATYHWHNLVDGRVDAVDQILSIGHTSGRDAWAGFITTTIALR